jgi:hypothetical protein
VSECITVYEPYTNQIWDMIFGKETNKVILQHI